MLLELRDRADGAVELLPQPGGDDAEDEAEEQPERGVEERARRDRDVERGGGALLGDRRDELALELGDLADQGWIALCSALIRAVSAPAAGSRPAGLPSCLMRSVTTALCWSSRVESALTDCVVVAWVVWLIALTA